VPSLAALAWYTPINLDAVFAMILTSLVEPLLLAIFAGLNPAGKMGQPQPETVRNLSGGHETLDGNS
jgi:hypothetical protein